MMMKRNSMADALHQRKGRGLDIAIIVGGAQPINSSDEEDKENKELGLAPEGAPVDEENEKKSVEASRESHGKIQAMAHEQMPSHYEHSDEMDDRALIQQELEKSGLAGKGSLSRRAFFSKIKK